MDKIKPNLHLDDIHDIRSDFKVQEGYIAVKEGYIAVKEGYIAAGKEQHSKVHQFVLGGLRNLELVDRKLLFPLSPFPNLLPPYPTTDTFPHLFPSYLLLSI